MTKPGTIMWLTGRPASGKSTLAESLLKTFDKRGLVTMWLDSDELRKVMTPQPTYSQEERDIFYSALGWIAQQSAEGGATVVISATAPRAIYRDQLRADSVHFVEIYLDCDERTCRQRDPKGLYKASDEGKINALPGVGSPYEAPSDPEITLHPAKHTPIEMTDQVMRWLEAHHESWAAPETES